MSEFKVILYSSFVRKHSDDAGLQDATLISLFIRVGRGSHSRGQAALPTAVRRFLNENG